MSLNTKIERFSQTVFFVFCANLSDKAKQNRTNFQICRGGAKKT